ALHMSALRGKADIPRSFCTVVHRNPSNGAVAEGVLLQTKFSTHSPKYSRVFGRTVRADAEGGPFACVPSCIAHVRFWGRSGHPRSLSRVWSLVRSSSVPSVPGVD